jgi:3-hydroxyisobutyrate dehydrogenase
MMKVAWIGTGVMGKPMALHLADAGHDVSVYNRTIDKAKALGSKVKVCESIKELVQNKDVVFSIVGYPSDVAEVYEEVIKYADAQTILVDMTTSSPKLAVELYEKAKKRGLSMLDAPVTGGDLGAINGTLSIMVGGEEKAYAKILPLLEKMGTKITYMGKPGSGMHAKLANQTVIAGNIVAIAEALTYAEKKGLDPYQMLEVIVGGSANSWQAAKNGPKMVQKDYQPGFYLKHYLKDLKLVLEEKENLKLPVVEKVADIYQRLFDLGFQDFGTQAVIEYYIQKLA